VTRFDYASPQPIFGVVDETASAELSEEGRAFIFLDGFTDIVDSWLRVSMRHLFRIAWAGGEGTADEHEDAMVRGVRRRTEKTKLRNLRILVRKNLPQLLAATFTSPKLKEVEAILDGLAPEDRRQLVRRVSEVLSAGIAKELEAMRSALTSRS
jgi:hypothetical protein